MCRVVLYPFAPLQPCAPNASASLQHMHTQMHMGTSSKQKGCGAPGIVCLDVCCSCNLTLRFITCTAKQRLSTNDNIHTTSFVGASMNEMRNTLTRRFSQCTQKEHGIRQSCINIECSTQSYSRRVFVSDGLHSCMCVCMCTCMCMCMCMCICVSAHVRK
jgi:hypothetical protein